jgi:restriction system protein
MESIWGIHNNRSGFDPVEQGFISIGWDEIGDLTEFKDDTTSLKTAVELAYPSAKPGAIPVWAGVLRRFAFEMRSGDFVIGPKRADSTLSFGRIQGEYFWESGAGEYRHRRKVEWLHTSIPRASFSQGARYEIGSAVTLFKVKTHEHEFRSFILGQPVAGVPAVQSVEGATATAELELNADRIEAYTSDFIIDTLHKDLGPYQFEEFVAALLRAMGYVARATQKSGDGGVDVIAHRDPLGLEPPIIKVQCKRMLSTIGAPDVQRLAGTLSHGGSEKALFVTLGSFSADAVKLERTRQDLRLIGGSQIADLIRQHYDELDPEWRKILPLRRVFVVDREPEL